MPATPAVGTTPPRVVNARDMSSQFRMTLRITSPLALAYEQARPRA